MNTTRRFLFGLISTLFLSVGLVRAAEHLDPVHVNGHSDKAITFDHHGNATVAEDCGTDWPPL